MFRAKLSKRNGRLESHHQLTSYSTFIRIPQTVSPKRSWNLGIILKFMQFTANSFPHHSTTTKLSGSSPLPQPSPGLSDNRHSPGRLEDFN